MSLRNSVPLAASGSTGNATHTGALIDNGSEVVAVVFNVTAVGSTPTVTWKIQGSFDSTDGADGNWNDAGHLPEDSDTFSTSTRVATAVGVQINYLARPYRWLRLVSSANTNVTYKADAYLGR